jgi:hypothetical protein
LSFIGSKEFEDHLCAKKIRTAKEKETQTEKEKENVVSC